MLAWLIILHCLCSIISSVLGSILPVIPNDISHLNYYYVSLSIGTPPQPLSLLIDTSCSHTYLNPPEQLRSRSIKPFINEYQSSKSSTFSWLQCSDSEHCNTCLSGTQHCAWEFACEQMYIMAKDIIHFNTNSSDANYLVFGYNAEGIKKRDRSHVFSFDDGENDKMVKGGILSLNRKSSSFPQQLYHQLQLPTNKQFAHYFAKTDGYMAFGRDVEDLIQHIGIEHADITWIPMRDDGDALLYRYQIDFTQISFNEQVIFSGNDILTFDTGNSGVGLSYEWRDTMIHYLTNASGITLVANQYYAYCMSAEYDDILDDILYKLPQIKIEFSTYLQYVISPEKYIVRIDNSSVRNQFCLDITFDEDSGISLGSHAMEQYLIVYNDHSQSIGIYDNNMNDENLELRSSIAKGPNVKYILVLSVVLVVVLISLVFVTAICVFILRGISKSDERDLILKRDSMMEGQSSPEKVEIDSSKAKKKHLDLEYHDERDDEPAKDNDDNLSVSLDMSRSPLQSYYDGNVKSIVYDQVV